MNRLFLVVLGFALLLYSDSNFPPGFVWIQNPNCGAVLIEPDVALVLVTCLSADMKVAWPQVSDIRETIKLKNSPVAILLLNKKLPEPSALISTAHFQELLENKQVKLFNLAESRWNWVEDVENDRFLLHFSIEEPFWRGTPVYTHPCEGNCQLLGLLEQGQTVLRLDLYYSVIKDELKRACLEGRRVGCQLVQPQPKPEPKLEPKLEPESNSDEAPQTHPSSTPPSAPLKPPGHLAPESLGCSCSQVRR